MYAMASLTAVDLCDNKLVHLPSRLGELPRLKHLWLARNQIAVFPESLARCSTLETLQLHENKLARLPDNVAGLVGLRALTLAKNGLEALPPTFRLLTALERLTLDHNTTMSEVVQGGMFFTELHALSALTLDRIVMEMLDKAAQVWNPPTNPP